MGVFTCFWAKKWTPADMMTLKKPVLFLRSESMVTVGTRVVRSCFIEAVLHQFQANCVRICNFLPEQCDNRLRCLDCRLFVLPTLLPESMRRFFKRSEFRLKW